MNRVKLIVRTLEKTRGYTNSILERIPDSEWFQMPPGGVTHVAWQVGHLTVAQYFLALVRIRGKRGEDLEIIPAEFNLLFSRTSIPNPDPESNPSVDTIRLAFDRVHDKVLKEIGCLDESVLDEVCEKTHPMFHDKFGALCWCSQHEFNHAGQISLIRRLLGHEFVW